MSDPTSNPAGGSKGSGLFQGAGETPKSSIPWQVWLVAGVVCMAAIAILWVTNHGTGRVLNPAHPDPYAANLTLSDIQMSQATNLAGGKVTYIDGTITNHGQMTVTGITVSTTFANDMGVPPQVETQQILLIRTREPYIDTEPVSSSPLKPGESHDFRLIFEQVAPEWNQTTPHIQVLGLDTR